MRFRAIYRSDSLEPAWLDSAKDYVTGLLSYWFCERKTVEAAYFTDLIQEIINRGYDVAAVKTEQLWRVRYS